MEPKYDSLTLKNQLCFPIYLCAKEVVRKYTPLLKKLDLTYTQYVVMMYFWEKRTSNVKKISKTLLIDSSTLTPLLKKLEKKGLIERAKDKEDGRNLMISITEKGLELRKKALVIPEKIGKCLGLSREEAEAFYMILYKILMNTKRREIS